MTYDPCPIADQIRAAREAGAAPGTVFIPKPALEPRRPKLADTGVVQPSRPGRHNNVRSMSQNAVRKRERRRVERMLAELGIGGAA